MHIDFIIHPAILRLLAMAGVLFVLFIVAGVAAHYQQAERLKVPAGVIAVTLMLAGLYWLVGKFI
jgi:hypothetical protein